MNGNSNSPSNGLTYWTRIVWIVRELGITTVVILVFLGMFIGWVKSPLTETQQTLAEHTQATVRYQEEQLSLLRDLINAQLATCVVGAQTTEEKRKCFEMFALPGP